MARPQATEVAEVGIAVSVLGPVALRIGAVPIVLPAKQAAVLAMLALDAGRVLSIDRLIDGVWGEDAPRTVRTNLQVQVSQLRQAIAQQGGAEAIVTRSPGYVLNIAPEAVDALRFGLLLSDARRCLDDGNPAEAARLAAAGLALWTGDPLSGLGETPFAGPVVTRMSDQRLDLVEVWADAEIGCGRASSVIPALEHWVSQSPYRETLWQRLILALYRCGRQVDALARLADLRRILRDEMGVRPCAAIIELETAVLDQDASLDAPPTIVEPDRLSGPGRRLPATKELIGRDDLVADVTERIAHNRLVTLVGPGGIGKTSLAVNVAAAVSERYSDGVWFADLSQVTDGTLVATTIGSALGIRTGDDNTSLAALVSLLADTNLLLVIDNCEHVIIHAAATIEAILQSCSGVRILATSRERLAISDETVIPLSGLQPVDAVALLERRALRGGANTSGDNATDNAQLCAAVDHLPLGIELVAARLQTMSAANILEQLGEGHVLQLSSRTANDRHRTLYSTIQWSYDLLSGAAQALLRRLSVFEGGATLDAILAVCSDPNGTVGGEAVVDSLDTVVAASLVAVDRANRQPRYRLLETVKAFAAGRLDADEQSEIRRRHAQEMIAWGERTRVASDGPDPAQAFNSLQAEAANLRAAGDFYVSSGDDSSLAKLIGALGPLLWRESGDVNTLNSWIDVVLANSGVEPEDRLPVLLVAAYRSGRSSDEERSWADEALALARLLDDEPCGAFAEFIAGDIRMSDAGAESESESQLVSAISRLEATGHWREAGHALNSYANLLLRQRRLDDAEALLGPRLRSHNSYGASEGFLSYQHARLLFIIGDVDGSDAEFDAAMSDAVRFGLPLLIGYAVYGKAWIAESRNDLAAAREFVERSLVINLQLADPREELNDRVRLIEVVTKLGDLAVARENATIIARLARNNPEPREIGLRAYARGLIASAEGDDVNARVYLLEALDTFAPTQMLESVAVALDALLRVLPADSADRLRHLPTDVRERRVSPTEAVAMLGEARSH
ncbi:MAG: winged helix-turn-helix domain-containing protein [Actinomycetia bacterium]|nr:winged helix-turn-helix domain-containing protein [Actinomycetes bacterium]